MKFKISLFIFLGFALFLAVQIPQIRQNLPQFFQDKSLKFQTLNLQNLTNLPNLAPGDLVFRLGDEFDSALIAQMSEWKYSHVGVVIDTAPTQILHAISDKRYAQNGVVISSLDEFVSRARKFGVARINFLSAQEKRNLINSLNLRVGEKFVLAKSTEPNLYCTTLIEHEIAQIYPNFAPAYTYIDAPFFRGEYLFPRAFAEFNGTQMIYESE
ncbi:MAG: hypothetical protein J6M14_07980 [Campylobacter sp.]|nr:hypothetical protein [Campylobacter sp.]